MPKRPRKTNSSCGLRTRGASSRWRSDSGSRRVTGVAGRDCGDRLVTLGHAVKLAHLVRIKPGHRMHEHAHRHRLEDHLRRREADIVDACRFGLPVSVMARVSTALPSGTKMRMKLSRATDTISTGACEPKPGCPRQTTQQTREFGLVVASGDDETPRLLVETRRPTSERPRTCSPVSPARPGARRTRAGSIAAATTLRSDKQSVASFSIGQMTVVLAGSSITRFSICPMRSISILPRRRP